MAAPTDVIPDLIGNLAMLYLTEKVIPDLIGNLTMIITYQWVWIPAFAGMTEEVRE